MREKSSEKISKFAPYLVTALILAVVLYVRMRLLAVPLERDEGEFAYMGQLLLKGIPPFSHAYTMKLPGVSIMYAFFISLFGQTPTGVHAGLLIVNGICVYLVYLLAQRLFDPAAALYSCAIYAVLSLSNSVYGLFAHATNFVVMFALAGFLLLLRGIERPRFSFLFAGGLCFGLAFTMKQHAALLLLFAVLYYAWRVATDRGGHNRNRVAGGFLLLTGMVFPYALFVVWMVQVGNFDNFWFWTVKYAREYAQTPPLAQGMANFSQEFSKLAKLQAPFWALAGVGLLAFCIKKTCCSDRLFVSGFLLFSFLATCPGLFFRGHYFVLLLPAVALVAGAGTRFIGDAVVPSWRAGQAAPAVVLLAAAALTFYLEKGAFFEQGPLEVSRAVYGVNPFPEAQQVAIFLKKNSAPNDHIAVLGSEPQIYFYADRLSATGHIYMYGLMENQPYAGPMQAQMIGEIEASQPKYVVLVNVYESWMVKNSAAKSFFDWAEQFLRSKYDPVGVVDIANLERTRYVWGDEAAGYTPVSGAFMTTYKRKGT